jgi:hypothetical protein
MLLIIPTAPSTLYYNKLSFINLNNSLYLEMKGDTASDLLYSVLWLQTDMISALALQCVHVVFDRISCAEVAFGCDQI